jgi:hypothetical protein|tara:strand:+ start:199 stop:426 length:228 start_codon:yes stop_codon:yes gene_type:complete
MHGLVGLYIETTLSISTHNLQKSYMALALLASATDKLSQKPIASEHAVTQVLPRRGPSVPLGRYTVGLVLGKVNP